MRRPALPLAILVLAGLGGCSTIYYAAMSQLGWAKADLLANRVQQARDAMDQARVQLADAVPDFEEARAAPHGAAVHYQALRASFADAHENATLIRTRRAAVESAAEALFGEWQHEIDSAADPGLRQRRQQRYDAYHAPFTRLLDAMRGAEAALPPVLDGMQAALAALRHPTADTPVPTVPAAAADRALRDLQIAVALANQYITVLETID
ncbi:DUF2959 family protein [bacterium]|nr:DUF2959 family protein [bacterium]